MTACALITYVAWRAMEEQRKLPIWYPIVGTGKGNTPLSSTEKKNPGKILTFSDIQQFLKLLKHEVLAEFI